MAGSLHATSITSTVMGCFSSRPWQVSETRHKVGWLCGKACCVGRCVAVVRSDKERRAVAMHVALAPFAAWVDGGPEDGGDVLYQYFGKKGLVKFTKSMCHMAKDVLGQTT